MGGFLCVNDSKVNIASIEQVSCSICKKEVKMDKLEIKGKVNTALCYAKVVEDEAIEQIRRMCDYDRQG